MKEDILTVIESKVSPLIKVWMNGENIPDEYIQNKPDTRYDIDVKIMAVKYLLLEYVNEYAPYDYHAKITKRLNKIFEDVDSSVFYIDGDLESIFKNVSYTFDFYLAVFYDMLMVNSGDEVDLEYVVNLLKKEEV
ncbi:hypothetical protein S875_004468 [Salmonella enterica]|uniref:Uncharacterized protein n=1 Tax=Salmonella enterica TaxID=28901 RepID=A0A743XH08_SALER|nr:hypothetical protein [Salmonella enterica]ECV4477874.1 hypothetical protein [Salmonella enterica subsp. enterica serovar Braenderup]EAQ0205840.1 hypothetical protein [Salmonella enterica]EAW8715945.1 hypothetical protein [Salmonella enterica]EAX1585621.1 hypothetical protein [Salmonella enterica]EAX3254114.1 hypothetical protein [Salmonella enterica]